MRHHVDESLLRIKPSSSFRSLDAVSQHSLDGCQLQLAGDG